MVEDWGQRVRSSLEDAWRHKDSPRKFGGELYYSWTSWVYKDIAEAAAKNARAFGFKARVLKYIHKGRDPGYKAEVGYEVVIRRK